MMARHDYVIDQTVVDLLAIHLVEKFGYLLNSDVALYIALTAVRELVHIQETTGKDLIVRSDVE